MKDIHLTDERYAAALQRIRGLIAGGVKLDAVDSTTVGDKYTECTWGLCSSQKAAWPDPEDHLWPDQFKERGRVAPKYRTKTHKCPMDKRVVGEDDMGNGCFYTCKVFQKGPTPSRDQALELYDREIAKWSGTSACSCGSTSESTDSWM
jgi:hypothetical protein